MYRLLGPRFTVLFDTPGDAGGGAGSGSPGGSATPPPSAPASPAPSGGAPPIVAQPSGTPGQPPPSSAGTPPPSTRFEYPEDRGAWIPPHRLSEVAQRAQAAERRALTLQTMLEAGTGVRMREEQRVDPAVTEARQAFESVFPGAGKLFDNLPKLMAFMEALDKGGVDPAMFSRLPDALQATDHQWEQHGRRTLDTVFTAMAKDYGATALSPYQQRVIGSAFTDWLQQDAARQDRYANADPKLTDEFLTEYRSGFVDPLRRSADADTIRRGQLNGNLPPAPRGGGQPPPPAQPPPTPEQVHDRAWATFAAAQAGGR